MTSTRPLANAAIRDPARHLPLLSLAYCAYGVAPAAVVDLDGPVASVSAPGAASPTPAAPDEATLGFVAVSPLRARRLRAVISGRDPALATMLWALNSRRAFARLTGYWDHLPKLKAFPPKASKVDPALDEAMHVLFAAPILSAMVLCWALAFTVPKKDGKRRCILSPKVNELPWVPPPSGLSGVRDMFTAMRVYASEPCPGAPTSPGSAASPEVSAASDPDPVPEAPAMYFMTIDGVSFFNQFRLGKEVQPFFSVLYRGRFRPYINLPMGWRGAPGIANRTLLALCALAGVKAVVWVDNILLYNRDKDDLQRDWARLRALFTEVNLSYRIESEAAPTVEFVGIHFQALAASDPEKVQLSLTDLWLSKFRTFVKTVVQQGSPVLTLDQIQKLAGYCIWIFMVLDVPLVTMSGVLTHLSVMTSPGAPSSARLPVAAARDTNTMLQLATSSRPLVKQRPKLHSDTLWTDSCSDGAASLWELQGPSGVRRWRWSHSALRAHINVKELSCLLWSLVRYKVRHVSVRWVTDSAVAFSVVKNMYARSPPLVSLLKQILAYCEEHDVHVLPFWISTNYMLADEPSRDVPLDAPNCDLFPPNTHPDVDQEQI